MMDKDAYIEHLENTIKTLQNQVSNLTEMVMLLRREKFGSSSEKTPKAQIEGQLSLFNEAEVSRCLCSGTGRKRCQWLQAGVRKNQT